MRMSDAIAAYILQMMDTDENGIIEIRRNELAGEIGCVPSQINYVLSSRFTPENGFVVESRRGGGGYVRVRRICFQSNYSMLSHIVNSIGDSLVESAAQAIVQNLEERQLLSKQTARVMMMALSNRSYRQIAVETRDRLRADMLKHMLTATVLSD